MMLTKSVLILAICLSLCLQSHQKQIFIDYGVGGQGRVLMKYFYDVEDAFYVDVGAYDPIFASNTLNLYTMGWGGINIDANPERLARFFMERPDQTNLNFAIGDTDQFVTLYEVDEDSSSTVSPKVKDYIQSFKPVLQQIKIPSLGLKQVCERYYYRKPVFMNLDIEGYGSQALQSNQWSNPLCVPEVIFSEINEETVQSGLTLPEQVLKAHGYNKQPQGVGLNEVYIHQSVAQKYKQKAKRAEQYIQKLDYQNINIIAGALSRHLNTSTQLFKHYEPTTDRMFHKFTKINEVIDLNHLNQVSNQLAPLILDRPIAIYHYHPLRNALIVSEGKFTTQDIVVQNMEYLEVVVEKPDGKKFSAYILNHRYETAHGSKPSVLSAAQTYILEQKKQFVPVAPAPVVITQNLTKQQDDEKKLIQLLLDDLTNQLNKQDSLLLKIQAQSEKFTKDLKETFIGQHKVEVSFFEKINAKTLGFEQTQPQGRTNSGTVDKTLSGFNLDIQNLMIIQNITFGLILLMSISICTSLCVLKKKKKSKYSSIVAGGESSAMDMQR